MRNYAVFILTHGRANRVKTHKALRDSGYTGKIYLIIDNEDDQIQQYIDLYGEKNVIVFDKKKAAEITDCADTITERNVVVFARNVCHEIAKDLGLTHFIEVDDDYSIFTYRKEIEGVLRGIKITKMDELANIMLDFLDASNALAIAPAQGGDYIGGKNGMWKDKIKRKAMNMFFCRTDRPFQFYGRLNEDVTAYTYLGQQGEIFLQTAYWMLNQTNTQQNDGGLTDAYLELGTYVKSFYSVMYSPSCVKISILKDGNAKVAHPRIHHRIDYDYCCPKIISEKYKRGKEWQKQEQGRKTG